MKKFLLLACALTLSACAPAVQLLQPNERSTLTRDGQSLVLANPGPDALTGDPAKPSEGIALVIDGSADLELDAQAKTWCTSAPITSGLRWNCNLPNLELGQQTRLAWTKGTVDIAAGLAYRPSSSAKLIPIWLK